MNIQSEVRSHSPLLPGLPGALVLLLLAQTYASAQLTIVTQPKDQAVIQGRTATFVVQAAGTQPITYQWRGYQSAGSPFVLNNEINPVLLITNVSSASPRGLDVVVSDVTGSVTSRLARLNVGLQPALITQPGEKVNGVIGEELVLTATAIGTEPRSYQWYFNGQPRSGATSPQLSIANAQSGNAGAYQLVVTNLFGSATSRLSTVALALPTLFAKLTNDPVVLTPGYSGGVVWADFDNDGFLDLFWAQFVGGTNFLFHNNGNGTFARVNLGSVLVNGDSNAGASAADYDNDGYLDVVVASGEGAARRNALFRNTGSGTFTRENAGGITNQAGFYFDAQWADYDNDGFVDLLITDVGNENLAGGHPVLWHNRGDATFVRVTNGVPAMDIGDSLAILWNDYDNDGRVDLLLLNYTAYSTNYLYHNLGGGNFTRLLDGPEVTDPVRGVSGSSGGDWGDYDHDGFPDLFVRGFDTTPNHLYHNNNGSSFSSVAAGAMLTPAPGFGAGIWGDYDNDGYLDLLIHSGHRLDLWHNQHDGTFGAIRGVAPTSFTSSDSDFYRVASWVDYDNDGFLDIHATRGNPIVPPVPAYLYHNSGNSNGWLEVKCVGTVANRAAIGTKVRVKATIDAETFWQMRELTSGSLHFAKPLVAHFGLGNATIVDSVRIEWPSGTVQEFSQVPPRQILTVIEPPRLSSRTVAFRPVFTLKGGRNMTYEIQGSSNLVDWAAEGSLSITNLDGTANLDLPESPATGGQHFYRTVLR